MTRILRHVPNGPMTQTTVCTLAMTLVSGATGVILLALYGHEPSPVQWLATAAAYGAGFGLVWLGHCRALIQGT